jgi:PAS domain S-box-containing protein
LEGSIPAKRATRTKSRRAEDQVRELRTIFDTLTDGVVVYDTSARIKRLNTAFRQLIGADATSPYPSQSIEERAAQIDMRDEHGKRLPLEQWPVQRILRGEVLTTDNTTDIIISTLDGRTIQLNASGAPLYDEQGNIIGAVTIYHDVTGRRKLEQRTQNTLQALLAMAEILVQGTNGTAIGKQRSNTFSSPISQTILRLARLARRVTESQRISVTLIDDQTKQLQPLVIVGTSFEEEQQWRAFVAGTQLSDHISDPQILEMLHAGKLFEAYTPDASDAYKIPNKPFPFASNYFLLLPMHIDTHCIGLVVLDYAERTRPLTHEEGVIAEAVSKLICLVLERERLLQEQAEAHANELALLEANRRMDEFLSIASHELRTPLTTINGNIQLAKRRLQSLQVPPDDITEFTNKLNLIQDLLSRAERQVRIQNRLVGDLLDVSRIQANRLELSSEPCDLAAIVREAVEDQHATVPDRQITLDMPPEANIPIIADPDRISQVVINYLTNAIKYSRASRPVAVLVTVNETTVSVSVRDQGPGIPPLEQERLWQRFYRVPGINVQNNTDSGLGIGLHICRSIIELHNGQVGVHSIPGHGSTFWFTLPLQK